MLKTVKSYVGSNPASSRRGGDGKENKMQEYRDGSFGDIMEADKFKELLGNPEELKKTKAIHFGTVSELEALRNKVKVLEDAKCDSVKNYLFRIEKKLNRIMIKLDIADKGEFLIV